MVNVLLREAFQHQSSLFPRLHVVLIKGLAKRTNPFAPHATLTGPWNFLLAGAFRPCHLVDFLLEVLSCRATFNGCGLTSLLIFINQPPHQ
jgi:hypothetical protein